MKLNELKKQNIILLGLGAENFFLTLWLREQGLTNTITIWDTLAADKLGERYKFLVKDKNINWILNKKLPELKSYSLIVRSPGVFIKPEHRKKLTRKLTGPMQLFMDFCPTKNIVGVTGTKGKGTTSSLIYNIIKTAKKKVWLGGNIGVAPFSFINQIKPTDWVVLELSSFQLQEITTGPKIAVFTNFSPEHLSPADPNNPNHHHSLNDYWQSKLNITRATKLAVINQRLKGKIKDKKLKLKFFNCSNLASNLPGEHNKENIAAAILVTKAIKIPDAIITKAVKQFKGLEYRIEKVGDKNGVEYYNDSFATTPEATQTALKSFSRPIILLASGAEKKSDFSKLAKDITKRVKYLVLFKGQATARLKKETIKAGFKTTNIVIAKSMNDAVKKAQKKASKGDIILMSPATASFGMFKNYKDRGKQFNQALN
ncbi:MAG: UDP-N-acetylmuramoyl-L-alanine--D-glutamate ligase [Candidatus Falkowbacteria bacterium]|nr:UDP-N-acetylmuramoyl-L-alanine--D-glutamate ligase [Candidatus Falkowbacteria bacterium]